MDWTFTGRDAGPAAVVFGTVLLQRGLWHRPALAILFRLPGNFLHEVCHLLVGLALSARPTRFSVWPQRTPTGFVLGQVGFLRLHMFNALPVAIAPLILLVPAFWGMKQMGSAWIQGHVLVSVSWGYLSTQCLLSCWPSSVDMAYAWRSLMGYVFLTVLGMVVYAGIKGWL